jgi:hypothetical protein
VQPSRQSGTRMHAGTTDGSVGRQRRVVFGVPTLLHVLTGPRAEMAGGPSSTTSSGVYLYELWQVD